MGYIKEIAAIDDGERVKFSWWDNVIGIVVWCVSLGLGWLREMQTN